MWDNICLKKTLRMLTVILGNSHRLNKLIVKESSNDFIVIFFLGGEEWGENALKAVEIRLIKSVYQLKDLKIKKKHLCF